MTSVRDEFEGSPEWTMARNVAVLARGQHASEQGRALGLSDRRLLWLFSDGQPRTLHDIAKELCLEQSTVNRQVNAALAEGYLRRYRDPSQSAKLTEATDEGLSLLRCDLRWHFDLYKHGLDAIPQSERALFAKLFSIFVDAYADYAVAQAALASGARTT